jgi:hypothetical protein
VRIVRLILSAALAASALVGLEILSTARRIRSAGCCADTGNMESGAPSGLRSLVDGNDPTVRYARGYYPGPTCRHTRCSLQELPAR